MPEEMWNWLCERCGWRGVAQELKPNSNTDEYWTCPKCYQVDVHDIGWHEGNKKI
jgi:uncharacterized cysteine cluster protein YcgN (CxxCxxCC family)|tara:strand:- start:140 stop:304 length:165 start_codon:yes stop_codon:yes gene_type:complete